MRQARRTRHGRAATHLPHEIGRYMRESPRLTSGSTRRGRLIGCASLAAAALAVGVAPSVASARSTFGSGAGARASASANGPNRGTVGGRTARHEAGTWSRTRPATTVIRHGSRASASARRSPPPSPVNGPLAPTKRRSWTGINDTNSTPPDETSAVGTSRYIELVNSKFAIYNKTGNTPVGTGRSTRSSARRADRRVRSPDHVGRDHEPLLLRGRRRGQRHQEQDRPSDSARPATPTTAADWCKYFDRHRQPTFYDFPKLGDSKFFAMIGDERVREQRHRSFQGSDLIAPQKPSAGTSRRRRLQA